MVIYVIFFLFCLVVIFFLAWNAPEGEEIPGVGFVEKKLEIDEQHNNLL